MRTRNFGVLAIAAVTALAAFGALAAKEKPLPAGLPPYGQDKSLSLPRLAESELPNGLKVWVVPRPGFPKVTAVLVVRGGTASDPKEVAGVAEVLAGVVKEGTVKRSSRQLAEELQAVGGELDTGATNDALYVTADCLASGTATLLAVLADVAQNAAFPTDEVELVKENTLQGLLARTSTPEFAADRAFAALVFGDHPYRTIAPTESVVQSVTPALLKQEYQRRFRPERALLVVGGDLDEGKVQKLVQGEFGGWRGMGSAAPPVPLVGAGTAKEIGLVDRPGSVQSEIRVGRLGPRVADPDYFPAQVANTIFGGLFSSRLTENIREDKGYTYSPDSRVSAYAQGGLLAVHAAVRNEVTAATLLEIDYEMDRMGATLPTDEELARAKRYQVGQYLLRNATQEDLLYTLAKNWINGLPPAALGDFVPRVNAVTAAQVREVGRKYFASRTQTVVIGGDASKVEDQVSQFGAVKRISP
jgi:zinc protease